MITLEVGNSYSKLVGLNQAQERGLRALLSYEVSPASAFFSGGHRPRRKSLLDKKGCFPTGLLTKVGDFLAWNFKMIDAQMRPKARTEYLINKGIVPYPSQLEAVKKATDCRRGIISMPTGSGKSLVIGLLIKEKEVKTLVVVPSLEIKEQLKKTLVELLGSLKGVTVENIGSPALLKEADYGCLIIDEAHHVAAATYQKLNKKAWNGIYYRYFMTATPFRNNENEALLFESIAGELLYQLSYQDAVDAGYIVPVNSYYYDVPMIETDAYTWSQVYSELVVNNFQRNLLIANTVLSLAAENKSTLCLVKEVKHGKRLAELTGCRFVSGQDEESRKYIEQFNSGKIKVLIGTEGVMGEGVDTKPCEFVVICGLGKAKSSFMQKVGRGVRIYPGKESAKIIIFRDKSHKFCLRHFASQVKILKGEYNSVPHKLG